MPIIMTEKQAIIQQLLASKTKCYQTEIMLLLKHKDTEAKDVKKHGKELSREIDALIGKVMMDWIGESEGIIADIKRNNKKSKQASMK